METNSIKVSSGKFLIWIADVLTGLAHKKYTREMKSTVINQQLLLLNSAAIIPVNLMQKIDMQIKEKVDPQ